MSRVVDVAAAVIRREDGLFLLGQRAPGTFYPGYWEFPGGKVEPGESPRAALERELDEELGIRVTRATPWLTVEHLYEHAHVRLHFFRVDGWEGALTDHIHSALSWQRPGAPTVAPMLPANAPVLKALELPELYAITRAAEIGADEQLRRLERALDAGLRLVQVREPEMAEAQRAAFARAAVALCRRHQATILVNGDAQLAREVDADGVHMKSAQLVAARSRPGFRWVGASCHDAAELAQAARLGVDFAVLGPVRATPSHPGQPGIGWDAFARLVQDCPMPVYALGGLGPGDIDAAREAGAHGVAALRAAWA